MEGVAVQGGLTATLSPVALQWGALKVCMPHRVAFHENNGNHENDEGDSDSYQDVGKGGLEKGGDFMAVLTVCSEFFFKSLGSVLIILGCFGSRERVFFFR